MKYKVGDLVAFTTECNNEMFHGKIGKISNITKSGIIKVNLPRHPGDKTGSNPWVETVSHSERHLIRHLTKLEKALN